MELDKKGLREIQSSHDKQDCKTVPKMSANFNSKATNANHFTHKHKDVCSGDRALTRTCYHHGRKHNQLTSYITEPCQIQKT